MSWKKKGNQKRKRVNEITTDGAIEGSKIDKSLKPLETATKRSQKSQRINRNLITKLHVLTNVEEKVLAAPTPGRVTGVKNCNVWNFKIAALHGESCLKHGAVTSSPFICKATVLPSQEKLRHRCVTESRDYLKQLCKDHGVIPPLMAWERWQSNSILQQQLTHRDRDACDIVTFNSSTNNYCRKITVDGEHSTDPMLPSEVQEPDEGLIQDLLRGGVNDIDAIKIASETTVHSKKMADKIQAYILTCFVPTQEIKTTGNKKKQRKQLLQRNQAIANTDLQPTVIDHKHSYDIYLGDKSKHVLKLNNAYYGKLRELYLLNRSQNQCSTTPSRSAITNVDRADTAVESTENSSEESVLNAEKIVPEKEEEDDIITKEFHSGLYVLLARYNALLGHGMQCALPEHVFQTLHEHTQTNFECFASPLNCRYSSYCSAFPDTDGIFGSKGSFFDFYPTSGSYEVNPPFIESIMVASVDHSHKLLTDSSDGLSFVFIIPGWAESDAYRLLEDSKFLVFRLAVAAKDHGYCSGAQHQRKDRYLEAPYDTIVYILQNKQGVKEYGSSISSSKSKKQFESDLRIAFSMAVPTEAMRLRRLKEGRGFGDLDGGGGVYKGKKGHKKPRLSEE